MELVSPMSVLLFFFVMAVSISNQNIWKQNNYFPKIKDTITINCPLYLQLLLQYVSDTLP